MSSADYQKRNVFILAICQALFMSGTSLIVATTALVGFELSPNKAHASLPFATQLIATMFTSIPAAMLMARIGRKSSFLIATIIGMFGGTLCTLAIIQHEFFLFISGSVLLGTFSGFANYYRFTVADNADENYKSRAISYVLAGGVLAAVIGPNLANFTKELIDNALFAGSYASTLVLYILSFLLLTFLKLPKQADSDITASRSPGRSLKKIAIQADFIVAVVCGMLGYAIMSLVMTATPLAMRHHEYSFSDTSFVIQWHVLGMFAPSFFTGNLINRFGVIKILSVGAMAGLACTVINLAGSSVAHFWAALLLLGVSWNFLFIGATTLLTETYYPEERFKTQALNDFLVFSMVAAASLGAGVLQHHVGWQWVNIAAIPAIAVILLSLLWLSRRRNRANVNSVLSKDGTY